MREARGTRLSADFVRTSWKRVSSASGASKRRTTVAPRPGSRAASSCSTSCEAQRTNVCSHAGRTERGSSGSREQRLAPGQRLTRGGADLHRDDLAGRRQAVEVDDLVVGGATAQARGVVARGTLDEHVEGAAHEALGALAGAPLHDLHEPLHTLDGDLVLDELVHELGRLGVAAGRVDEGEGAVETDLFDDLEGLDEVRLGLPREADDDVRGQRAVRYVLADQRDAVEEA